MSSSSRDSHSQEWWEHVLPPGQLAERLRKAQRSTSASRRRNNPALANATPSERSAWKRLSGIPTETHQHDRSEPSTAASSSRSSFNGGVSPAAATLPRSALRSSHRSHDAASISFGNPSQSESSAEVSSDEIGSAPSRQHMPHHQARFAFPTGERDSAPTSRRSGVKTTGNSPEFASSSTWAADSFDPSRSISRSSGGRRKRVMSEDGTASSFFASTQSSLSSSSSSSYRLPGSHSAVYLSQLASNSSDTSTTWTSTVADRVRSKYAHHSLPDNTPELSSDDGGANVTTFSTTTTAQRVRKTSTTKTTVRASSSASSSKTASPPTDLRSHFDRPDQPTSTIASDNLDKYLPHVDRRDRHVSFDQATEIPRRASVQDWSEPITSSQSAFSFGSLPSRDFNSPFDSLPPRSNSTRRPRQGVRTSGRRTTSFSLPGSRRGSIRGDSPFHHSGATADAAAAAQHPATHHRRVGSIPDVVLLESLNVAQKQLASAGNLALTLTRQLSAPLRPVFHMTLFLSISSITVLSLACFLCASYMLTAWDDVSKRTQKVGEVAGRTKYRFERTLDWGLRMLGPTEASTSRSDVEDGKSSSAGKAKVSGEDAGATAASSGAASSKTGAREKRRGPVLAAGHALFWPARVAFSGASVVASTFTPPAVSGMFSSSGKERPAQAKGKTRSGGGSTLPPRPPLSTLLPSILFTLLLAIGAGLTSFLASRRAATEAASAAATGGRMPDTSSARPYSVPLSGSPSPHLAHGDMPWGHFSAPSTSASSPSASPFVGSRRTNAGWDKDAVGGQRRAFGTAGLDAGAFGR